MTLLTRINALLDATTQPLVASAHCDCHAASTDPAQARIEAQSVKGCMEKYNASSDDDFQGSCDVHQRGACRLVKHTSGCCDDYFKVEHLKEYPNCTTLWMATKSAGETKKTNDVAVADRLLKRDRRHRRIFWPPRSNCANKNPGGLGHRIFCFKSSSEFGVGRTVRE